MWWAIIFTLTLIFWQFFPLPLADRNEKYPTQQDTIRVEASDKQLITDKTHYKGILLTRADLREMLVTEFGKYGIESELKTAYAVAECESSWAINANNGVSFGIFQFTRATWSDFGSGDIFNPQTQIRVTAKIVKREGWGRWDCFTGQR